MCAAAPQYPTWVPCTRSHRRPPLHSNEQLEELEEAKAEAAAARELLQALGGSWGATAAAPAVEEAATAVEEAHHQFEFSDSDEEVAP